MEVLHLSQSNGLDHEVAHGGSLDRPCPHRTLKRIGCPLVEELILTASPDNMKGLDGLIGQGFQILQRLTVEQGQALK